MGQNGRPTPEREEGPPFVQFDARRSQSEKSDQRQSIFILMRQRENWQMGKVQATSIFCVAEQTVAIEKGEGRGREGQDEGRGGRYTTGRGGEGGH